jgi:DNA mismatch repair protein MutL
MNFNEPAAVRRIHLLPEEIFNRIAAGEVVERPASVLKELIENSLDAGATSIEAKVSGAGRREILVTDNGLGMGREDLLMAFERHATSKVRNLEDLLTIQTLGFRGEALPAIASVSRVEVTSQPRGSLSAFRLKITAGRIQDLEETGAPEGTTFIVRDLFFNTPARKKFLKSSGVENSHLLNVFKRYALAYPELRWAFTLDDREVYRLPAESLVNRIPALFSDELIGRLFPIEMAEGDTRISGFIGAPSLARRSRGDQHLLINRRWVQHRLLAHACLSAYGPLLEPGSFPIYVLFLTVLHEDVDVNVHPAKTEVKLRRENEAYSFVHKAIQTALQQAGVAAMPVMQLKAGEFVNSTTGEITSQKPAASPIQSYRPSSIHTEIQKATPEAYELMFGQSGPKSTPSNHLHPSSMDDLPDGQGNNRDQRPDSVSSTGGERTHIYQLHQRYIVTEIKGGIAIIDQHAAHERVLYEKALKALTGNRLPSQQLLFPRILELDPESTVRLREVMEDLQALGITIREFGERSFVLEALPMGTNTGQEGQIITEILDELKERGSLRRPGSEQVAAAFACRAAIKFGMPLNLPEMNGLIDQLFATKFPFTCPHGRPTLLQLTLGELERRFGRA